MAHQSQNTKYVIPQHYLTTKNNVSTGSISDSSEDKIQTNILNTKNSYIR